MNLAVFFIGFQSGDVFLQKRLKYLILSYIKYKNMPCALIIYEVILSEAILYS